MYFIIQESPDNAEKIESEKRKTREGTAGDYKGTRESLSRLNLKVSIKFSVHEVLREMAN